MSEEINKKRTVEIFAELVKDKPEIVSDTVSVSNETILTSLQACNVW